MMNDRSDKVFVDSNMIIFAADFKNANVFEWINELYHNVYIHKEVYNELLFSSVKKAVDELIASGEWIFFDPKSASSLSPIEQEIYQQRLNDVKDAFHRMNLQRITVCALNIIAEKKVNTLIVVNKTSLVSMWQEKIQAFLDFPDTENEKEAKKLVGQLGGGKKKLTQKIDIALLQSLYHKGEVHECLQDYGMIIVDECHHISAFSFDQVLQAAPAKYVYGLTATPTRKDGLQPIVYMQCGPIRYKDNAKKQAKARPFDHKVRMQFTAFDPTIRQEMSLQQVYQQIFENEERNSKLVADIIKNYREGRNAIILTERVAHVKRLEELLREEIPDVVAVTGGWVGRQNEKSCGKSVKRR